MRYGGEEVDLVVGCPKCQPFSTLHRTRKLGLNSIGPDFFRAFVKLDPLSSFCKMYPDSSPVIDGNAS